MSILLDGPDKVPNPDDTSTLTLADLYLRITGDSLLPYSDRFRGVRTEGEYEATRSSVERELKNRWLFEMAWSGIGATGPINVTLIPARATDPELSDAICVNDGSPSAKKFNEYILSLKPGTAFYDGLVRPLTGTSFHVRTFTEPDLHTTYLIGKLDAEGGFDPVAPSGDGWGWFTVSSKGGGFLVSVANLHTSVQRQGIGTKVYDFIDADIAAAGIEAKLTPSNHLNDRSTPFWAKRLARDGVVLCPAR